MRRLMGLMPLFGCVVFASGLNAAPAAPFRNEAQGSVSESAQGWAVRPLLTEARLSPPAAPIRRARRTAPHRGMKVIRPPAGSRMPVLPPPAGGVTPVIPPPR